MDMVFPRSFPTMVKALGGPLLNGQHINDCVVLLDKSFTYNDFHGTQLLLSASAHVQVICDNPILSSCFYYECNTSICDMLTVIHTSYLNI